MSHKKQQRGALLPSHGSRPGKGAVCITVLFTLVLAMAAVWMVWMVFVWSLREQADLPAAGPVSGDLLTALCFAAGGVMALLSAAVMILVNVHRLRRVFLGLGMAGITAALLSTAAGLGRIWLLQRLNGEWQALLVDTTAVFRDFSFLWAVLLAAGGGACLSIYGCIRAVRGGRYETED